MSDLISITILIKMIKNIYRLISQQSLSKHDNASLAGIINILKIFIAIKKLKYRLKQVRYQYINGSLNTFHE